MQVWEAYKPKNKISPSISLKKRTNSGLNHLVYRSKERKLIRPFRMQSIKLIKL